MTPAATTAWRMISAPTTIGGRRFPPIGLVVLSAVGAALLLVIASGRWGDPQDQHAYWLAAQRLINGQPLYDPTATSVTPYAYWYPPPLAQVLVPVAAILPVPRLRHRLDRPAPAVPPVHGRLAAARCPGLHRLPAGRRGAVVRQRPPRPGRPDRARAAPLAVGLRGRGGDQDRARPGDPVLPRPAPLAGGRERDRRRAGDPGRQRRPQPRRPGATSSRRSRAGARATSRASCRSPTSCAWPRASC